ncbi:MAG: hypothetical protein AAF614_11450 [Chloroflexota bacterium]
MHRIEREFEGQVDFFHFNIDVAEQANLRQELGLFRRSTYILLDPMGNEINVWIGYLDAEAVLTEMVEFLGQSGT